MSQKKRRVSDKRVLRAMTDSGETSPSERVIFGRYALGHLLGRGASARVYLARDLSTGHSVAVKVFPKPRLGSASPSSSAAREDGTASVLREISALRRLRHPHILRLHEVLASRSKVYLVLELAKGGALFSRLAAAGRLPEDLSRRLFRQLLSAVSFSHSRCVFHRDLKPENLLIDEAGDLKISDFGLSAIRSPSAGDDDLLLHTLCGTPAYVAPEMLSKKGYDGRKVDIWSAGVILFVLNAGYLPFNDPNLAAMYRKIYRGQFRCPLWTSPELRRLLGRMLDPDPETRIGVEDIIRDPWFKKGGFDAGEWAAAMRPREDRDGAKLEVRTARLNAFDIISFSSGLDLSGLFEPGLDRETFASAGSVKALLQRVEEVGRSEGLAVRRKENKNGFNAAVEGKNGDYEVRIEAYGVADGAAMVEVEVQVDKAATATTAEVVRFWKEKLSPVLKQAGRSVQQVTGLQPGRTMVSQ